jgi:hypothetical protein
MAAIIYALVLLWLASGAASLIYWWTKFLPFTKEQFWLAAGCSLLGPLAFFVVRLGIVLSGEQHHPNTAVLHEQTAVALRAMVYGARQE